MRVTVMASVIESVIRSAYMMTLPRTLRAARPMVWISERSARRKPSLSASRMATSDTSGRSSPSRSRLMPDQHVELAEAQIAQDLDALEGVDVRVQVAHPDARARCNTRSDPRPSAWSASSRGPARPPSRARGSRPAGRPPAVPTGPHLDLGIEQPGRADDLLDDHALRAAGARIRPASPTRRWSAARAPPTRRSAAAGCRAPTAAGSRTRPGSPCATGRRCTSTPICGTVWWDSSTNSRKSLGK